MPLVTTDPMTTDVEYQAAVKKIFGDSAANLILPHYPAADYVGTGWRCRRP